MIERINRVFVYAGISEGPQEQRLWGDFGVLAKLWSQIATCLKMSLLRKRIKADHLDNIGNPTHKEKNQAEFIITFNAIIINSWEII